MKLGIFYAAVFAATAVFSQDAPRWQLYSATVAVKQEDGTTIPSQRLFRIDTTTGRTWMLMLGTPGTNSYLFMGWAPLEEYSAPADKGSSPQSPAKPKG